MPIKTSKLLDKIKSVPVPPKFTQDFLATKLQLKSSSYHAMIPLLKKLGFLDASGIPIDNYKDFKDSSKSSAAMNKGMKEAFSKLYEYSEYPEDLNDSELKEKISLALNLKPDDDKVQYVAGTFTSLKEFVDYQNLEESGKSGDVVVLPPPIQSGGQIDSTNLGINYTINITLPNTTEREVFEAIFDTMKKHLLK